MNHMTVLIDDVYQRDLDAQRNHYKVDYAREAESLSLMVRPWPNRRIAIIHDGQQEAIDAFSRAGFTICTMNGNRATEIVRFISEELRNLRANPPEQLIVVSDDPTFDLLCSPVADNTQVMIWSASGEVPQSLVKSEYEVRRLDDILPGTKIKVPTVAVYLDYENLHIGLEQMGIKSDPQEIIEAVRALVADLGVVAEINAYADWFEISNKGKGPDIQRQLAGMPLVKTHYQVGQYGKNSSDMAIADDIRTRIDRDASAADYIDTLVVGTRDRDFIKIIETAKGRGKKVVILGLQYGLSRQLQELTEVRYIDQQLTKASTPAGFSRASIEQFAQAMRMARYLEDHHWRWGLADQLAKVILPGQNGTLHLRELVKTGIIEEAGQPGRLQLNRSHPDGYFASWLTNRLFFLLDKNKKGLEYVDTGYLARGMEKDEPLRGFQIGQSRSAAEAELQRAVGTGCIIMVHRPHPRYPEKSIDTWWPSGYPIPAIEPVAEVYTVIAIEPADPAPPAPEPDQGNEHRQELPKSF